jgi:hypothetical protein
MMLVGGLTQMYPHAKALSRIQLVMQKTIVATSNIFDTMEQTQPDLVTAERGNQRILRIVDLDQVLEFHASMLTSAPCN